MELNKCILTGNLSSQPTVFSNHLGSFLELSISQEEEVPTSLGKTKSTIVNFIVLYAGKLEEFLLKLTAGARLYIEGRFTYGKFYDHESPSLIFSSNVHLIQASEI